MHCREGDLAAMLEMWYRRTILFYQSEMWAVMLNEAVHTKVVTLIWGGFYSWTQRGLWRAGLCFHVNRVDESLYPTREIRQHSKQKFRLDSEVCFSEKHKQPIKLQPRKILWHIKSPKRLGNSAVNPHKPDTWHNRMTLTQLFPANGGENQRVTHHMMLLRVTQLNQGITELVTLVFSDVSPPFVFTNQIQHYFFHFYLNSLKATQLSLQANLIIQIPKHSLPGSIHPHNCL